MVSSVTESLVQARTPMWARIFLPLPSPDLHTLEGRDEYDHSGF